MFRALSLTWILCVALLPAILAASAKGADASGAWAWSQTRPDGESIAITVRLRQDGEKLTGSFHGKGPDSNIYDGSIRGDEVNFSVDREVDGHDVTMKYSGKISGDTVKGEVNMKAGFRHKKSDWEAKRAAP